MLVVIGMNNPLSADPEMALFPQPVGSAGHRLWALAHARSRVTMRGWLDSTERLNLVEGQEWSREAALARAPEIFARYRHRTVLLLGNQVRDALGVRMSPCLGWALPMQSHPRLDWCMIPHPSGRNHFYNDEVCRTAVEVLLDDLLRALRDRTERHISREDRLPKAHTEQPDSYWHLPKRSA